MRRLITGHPGQPEQWGNFMTDRIRLDGRVVVTGAAGITGTATMRLLAERGGRLVAVARPSGSSYTVDGGRAAA